MMKEKLKITAFNGSARKDGNTAILLRTALEALSERGFDTELVQLSGKPLRGCAACGGCIRNKDNKCVLPDDGLNGYVAKMRASAGILIGSPTYFADVSSETKALIDRAGYVGMANGGLFRRKAGAAVVAVRRGGAIHAFDTINHFFTIGRTIRRIGQHVTFIKPAHFRDAPDARGREGLHQIPFKPLPCLSAGLQNQPHRKQF